MTIDPDTAVVACLIGFSGLSFVDGIVIHLWRKRLHRRADARVEHPLHSNEGTVRPDR
jgi:hypothetical protein